MKTLDELRPNFGHWEKTKDLIDQCIDLMLNFRQSGHPGGSRSKVHGLVTTLLSGAMRWDIREPGKRFGDRFILVAGHTNPLVYAALAVFNEALRVKFEQTGDERYRINNATERTLYWEDLLTLRRSGGLSGHAEMSGKTLFFKFSTGPSGHGSPVAVGQALALKYAGCDEVKVFAFEGEGGLTTGAAHESKNSAYGLGLGNLVYFVDWNDYGIDDRTFSSVVHGTPVDWFEPYGWRVEGTEEGENWEAIMAAYLRLFDQEDKFRNTPKMLWTKNRKGRGYGVYDNKSHGTAHKMNSEIFWETKRPFAEQYGVEFDGFGEAAPVEYEAQKEQSRNNLDVVMDVLRRDQELVDYLANTLIGLGNSVPEEISSCRITTENPSKDSVLTDYQNYPEGLFLPPGTKAPNRKALAVFGSWINSYCRDKYGRPLVIASSADLADSTNISGFGKGWEDSSDFGFYDRKKNLEGTILPQPITEFCNSGIMAGLATVNFAEESYEEFNGFFGASSTYGSFSYLMYGLMRLFSQVAQDSELQVGRVIWVAGHSGPETAEDARTHFGIFSPGVTQLFPEGAIVNLHPWEYNEVAPMLGAALATKIPIIALHLTRPPVEIPDREALGMASYMEAAKGAYIIRGYDKDRPKEGVVIIRGTSSTANLVKLLPRLNKEGPNVKIVYAGSWVLFQQQSEDYREKTISKEEINDAMIITNGSLAQMRNWMAHKDIADYSLSSDWDNRWRTGGSIEDVLEEAHLSEEWIWKGIERFYKGITSINK